MANLGFEFDPDQVEPLKPLEPVPTGKYLVMITDSEVTNNSKNTGTLLKLTLDILEGEYQGQKVFDNVNLTHNKPEAQSMGQSQLSSIFRACGKGRSGDSSVLHNIPISVNVEYRPKTEQYRAGNNVQSYEPIQQQPIQQQPIQQQPIQQQPIQQQPIQQQPIQQQPIQHPANQGAAPAAPWSQ